MQMTDRQLLEVIAVNCEAAIKDRQCGTVSVRVVKAIARLAAQRSEEELTATSLPSITVTGLVDIYRGLLKATAIPTSNHSARFEYSLANGYWKNGLELAEMRDSNVFRMSADRQNVRVAAGDPQPCGDMPGYYTVRVRGIPGGLK